MEEIVRMSARSISLSGKLCTSNSVDDTRGYFEHAIFCHIWYVEYLYGRVENVHVCCSSVHGSIHNLGQTSHIGRWNAGFSSKCFDTLAELLSSYWQEKILNSLTAHGAVQLIKLHPMLVEPYLPETRHASHLKNTKAEQNITQPVCVIYIVMETINFC